MPVDQVPSRDVSITGGFGTLSVWQCTVAAEKSVAAMYTPTEDSRIVVRGGGMEQAGEQASVLAKKLVSGKQPLRQSHVAMQIGVTELRATHFGTQTTRDRKRGRRSGRPERRAASERCGARCVAGRATYVRAGGQSRK